MTTTAIELRPYQREAIAAVIRARKDGVRRQLVCLPTGAGKTVIFSELARRAKRPVLVLAHREELVEQARDKLGRALGDHEAVGIEQGGRRAEDVAGLGGVKVVVASIRSLRSERLERLRRGWDFGLVIYDECHHAPAEDNLRVLRELGAFDLDWSGTLLGVTATTQRGDGKGLHEVFEEVVYHQGLRDLVHGGYLAPLRGFRVATEADLARVGVGSGDYVLEELAEAVDIEERNALVARTIQELARDRRTIAFCVNVAHAIHLSRALRQIGVAARAVYGAMDRAERAQVLREFREGRWQVITNVAVLTEGFDDPGVSCVAMARPTRSSGLYAQCVGRGTRLAEGKRDCLVLDFVDLSGLDLVTLPSLFGFPRNLELHGEDVLEAERRLGLVFGDNPGFDLDEAEAVTLDEIERRAAAFDPLTLEVHDDVRAISPFAWWSLGRAGLALVVERGRRRCELLVLAERTRGRTRYRVLRDGKKVAQFGQVDEAVEAVDYEVRKWGKKVSASAWPSAAWRHDPPDADVLGQLRALTPPQRATTTGEALRLLLYTRENQRPQRKRKAPAKKPR